MNPIDEYIEIIDRLFGVYFDATYGFHLGVSEIQRQNEEALEGLEGNLDKARYELDLKQLTYSIDEPSEIAHSVTVRDYKYRNWPGGHNEQWAARMALVTIYSFWEHRYRSLIAKHLDKKPDDLKIDELGDLRHYRHAIIHYLGRGYEDFNKLKVFKWFEHGEEVRLDVQKMRTITESLKAAITKLNCA